MKQFICTLMMAFIISVTFAQTTVTKTLTDGKVGKDTIYNYFTQEVVTTQHASSRIEIHPYKAPPVVIPPVVIPPPVTGTIKVGGTKSGAINVQSNTTISGKTIDLANSSATGLNLNGVSNVHITNCHILNGKGFGININNCTNITIDNTLIENMGFGVYAQNSKQVKVNGNQLKTINGINESSLGHAVQFNNVQGGGNSINNNIVYNIDGVSLHPHDQLNVYKSSGIKGDSIMVVGNLIIGGQRTAWPSSGSTGAGIIMNDESGMFQVCRNNICIRSGCNGIQSNTLAAPGGSTSIDHNICFNDLVYPVAANGINILGTHVETVVSYNRIDWINKNGLNVNNPDGETNIYFGNSSGSHSGTTLMGNIYNDKTIKVANYIPAVIITMVDSSL